LKKALELSPNMPDALMQLGLCSGNHDKYREYISRAIQLKPDYAAAYNNRAMIYYDPTDNNLEYLTNEEHQDVEKINKLKNNFRNAIADITEAIKLRPNDALYHLNRGVFHSRLGEHKEAIDDFYKAINYASDVLMDKLKTVVVIFKLLGKEYLELNDYNKAIGNFTEILCNMPDFKKIITSKDTSLKQNFYEILRMRGKAYFLAGEKMKAKADFGEYLKRKREETAAVTRNSIFKLIGVMPEDI
ncbi:MAG: tetratricopeptide repeat protein, partial [Treponema sp.]|jgi:tetratricopeptide (TPR) repeat protein|nr:tetratricopeptide repeat protein [Treponema sp.]